MADPSWGRGNIWQSPGNFTFPNPQTFVNTTGASESQIVAPIVIPAGWNYFEFVCVSNGSGGVCIGVVTTTNPNTNIHQNIGTPNCTWLYENGAVFTNGSYVGYSLTTPNTTNLHYACLVNPTLGQMAFSPDGVTWNNGHSASDIFAGTGVITLGYTGDIWPFISLDNIDCSWAIYASSENCAYALPDGASYLPANSFLSMGSVVSYLNEPVQIEWSIENNPCTGLEYSLNNGTFTACTGIQTGTTGLALGPTITGQSVDFLAIRETADIYDQTSILAFQSNNPPEGAGALLYSSTGGSLASVSINATNSISATAFIFSMYFEAVSTSGTMDVTGGNNLSVTTNGTGSGLPYYQTEGNFGTVTAGHAQNGYVGFSAISGPSSVPISQTSTVSGTIILSQSGSETIMNATINNNGTLSTFQNGFTTADAFANIESDSGVIYPFTDTYFNYSLDIYAVALPEILTIDSASYTAGTLTIVGESNTPYLHQLNISTNNGTTSEQASTLELDAGTYTATLNGTFGNGVYSLQSFDVPNDVASNVYTFSITPPPSETLTLLSVSGTIGGTLSIVGTVTNDSTLTGLDYSINAGSSFEASSNFTVNETGSFSCDGSILSAGTFVIGVKDIVTADVSNFLTYTLAPPGDSAALLNIHTAM